MNKLRIAYECIEKCLIDGMTNKVEIYNKVESESGIPRPTIRQACRMLRKDYGIMIQDLERKN